MILAFTRFDLGSLLASPVRAFGPIIFVMFVAVVAPFPLIAVPAAAAAVSMGVGTPFLNDERGRLDVLYATLPINRSTVVVGRYVEMAIWYVVAAALATGASIVATFVRGQTVSLAWLGLAHALSFMAVAITLALQVPVFFSVGYTRGKAAMFLPAVVIGAACSVAAGLSAGSHLYENVAASGLTPLLAVAVGVIAVVISVLVSVRIYTRRQL
jgi:ABC-2 family transporter protein